MIRTAPGVFFAPSKREALDTLFAPVDGRTASGWYKRTSGGVTFYGMDGEPFAHLVINRYGERFFVTASRSPSDNGRTRYMYALADRDGERLGVAGLSYGDERRLAHDIAARFAA
jgi:hypothetical protein